MGKGKTVPQAEKDSKKPVIKTMSQVEFRTAMMEEFFEGGDGDTKLDVNRPKKCVKQILEGIENILAEFLTKKNTRVKLPLAGLTLAHIVKPARKARMGRNPATGETIEIAAKPKKHDIKARIGKKWKTETLGEV